VEQHVVAAIAKALFGPVPDGTTLRVMVTADTVAVEQLA
jgi:hypothetical protein